MAKKRFIDHIGTKSYIVSRVLFAISVNCGHCWWFSYHQNES